MTRPPRRPPEDEGASDSLSDDDEYTRRFRADVDAGVRDADVGRVVSADELRAELARRRVAR